MAQIIHLATGKHPAQRERFLLVESCARGGRTAVTHARGGIVVRVPAPFFRTEIDAFLRMAHEAGIEKLYVRGAGEELSVRSRSVALSSWAA
jgi:hypothetical protein